MTTTPKQVVNLRTGDRVALTAFDATIVNLAPEPATGNVAVTVTDTRNNERHYSWPPSSLVRVIT